MNILYMSLITYWNPQISAVIERGLPWKSVRKFVDFMKVCAEIRGLSVANLRNHLSGSTELSFGNPHNCLLGACRFVLWEFSKQSLGDCRLSSPWKCLQESAKSSSESLISFVTHAVNMHNWLSLNQVTVSKCIQQSQTKRPKNKAKNYYNILSHSH